MQIRAIRVEKTFTFATQIKILNEKIYIPYSIFFTLN
jgi:hypothetical protein